MDEGSLVSVRSGKQLELMRVSGKITAKVLKKVLANVRPGVSLLELEEIADEEIIKLGGKSSFKSVPGYLWTTCLTVNEEVVHGIPRDIKLKKGDLLSIDLGAVYQGWHTDAAWSVMVGSQKKEFLEVGEEVLGRAINEARAGRRIGDISAAIQQGVEKRGFSVVKSFAGHGVGKSAHEEPEIPTFGQPGTGLVLKAGMSLAIEVIYAQGSGMVYEKEDGWTIATLDQSLAALFEMSVVVGKKKAEVLTDWRKLDL